VATATKGMLYVGEGAMGQRQKKFLLPSTEHRSDDEDGKNVYYYDHIVNQTIQQLMVPCVYVCACVCVFVCMWKWPLAWRRISRKKKRQKKISGHLLEFFSEVDNFFVCVCVFVVHCRNSSSSSGKHNASGDLHHISISLTHFP